MAARGPEPVADSKRETMREGRAAVRTWVVRLRSDEATRPCARHGQCVRKHARTLGEPGVVSLAAGRLDLPPNTVFNNSLDPGLAHCKRCCKLGDGGLGPLARKA